MKVVYPNTMRERSSMPPRTRLQLPPWKGGYLDGHYRVTFCGFFPFDNPRYTCEGYPEAGTPKVAVRSTPRAWWSAARRSLSKLVCTRGPWRRIRGKPVAGTGNNSLAWNPRAPQSQKSELKTDSDDNSIVHP